MDEKVRKIILYSKKLKKRKKEWTRLPNTLLTLQNWQVDAKIIHVKYKQRQYSITASQNIFNSIYMADV